MILIPIIILTIVIFKIYHKIFNVTYFGLTALIKEIFMMLIIATLIFAFIVSAIFG